MARHPRICQGLDRDPLWYKSGVIYEVNVRAFCDSNDDGAGDFPGLTSKLDYLKDLGVTALWLLPFYPSPLKDDGYDIADYCDVHPMYGTLNDFKSFLREAHCRGLRVITELVLNHTSDQHPWFQRARRGRPGSRWRNFYTWSDEPTRYKDARIIFKDVEKSNWTWDHTAKAYFWHRFFSHQPDLNYESPDVHEAITKVVDFWFDLGVDGLRLDAVPYLYEREGTGCENLPETHAFLKKLRHHVEEKYADRMLLAEANQWPEDAVAYFGNGRGDECHMAFHFPLMPRLFMALRMEDRLPIVDILEQTPPLPETGQWALFLRNHDELTLEMVTDEERDYMYRMYASVHQARLNLGIRRRLAPLLGNDRKRIELLNALLFSLPGTPVIYYGDEIGLGENIYLGDRNGVRTPMQWSSDKNAGFSRANPQSLYLPIILDPAYHYEAVNVEVQLANPHSLLWWMRRMLALRKRWRALGEGKAEFLQPDNRKILCYVLRHEQETLLVVANLSRFVQAVELDLSGFQQRTPIELLGRTRFPVITERPYFLSLGPHGFYWFLLEPAATPLLPAPGVEPALNAPPIVVERWQEVIVGIGRGPLGALLPDYLGRQTWFLGRGKTVKAIGVMENIEVALGNDHEVCWTLLEVEYVEGDVEVYSLPLAFATGAEERRVRQSFSGRIIAQVQARALAQSGVVYDAFYSPRFCQVLLELVWHRRRFKGVHGEVEAVREPSLRRLLGEAELLERVSERFERRNSSLAVGSKLFLKLFRRLDPGDHPEIELGRFLNHKGYPQVPVLGGVLEYRRETEPRMVLAALQQFIPHAGDGRLHALEALGRYYDRVITWVAQGLIPPSEPDEAPALLERRIPASAAERIGTYLESARLLGLRTAELHLAMTGAGEGDPFTSEEVTPHYLRGIYQSMRNLAVESLRQLRRQAKTLTPDLQMLAQRVLDLQAAILQQYHRLVERRVVARRIRIHGDLDLGQVLWTGRDFFFIDLEGNPLLSPSERGIKRSPLRDVASMLRSFHYSAYAGLYAHIEGGSIPQENLSRYESWVQYWNRWVSVAFLNAYLPVLTRSDLLPGNEVDLREMLRSYLLNQVMVELGLELARQPGRLRIPLQGICHLAGDVAPPAGP